MQKVTQTISKEKSSDDSTESTSDKVTRINIKIRVKNLTGTFNVTDLMLQTGDKSTMWNGHPSEVRWLFDG